MSHAAPLLPPVVLTAELSRSALRAELRAGTLRRVCRGGYLPKGYLEDSSWGRRVAVMLSRAMVLAGTTGPNTAFSHLTAAAIHGLWIPPVETVHLTVPFRRRRPPKGVIKHQSRLDPTDVTTIHGLRVTTLTRTVLDCARAFNPRTGMAAVDSALRVAGGRSNRWDVIDDDPVLGRWAEYLAAWGPVRGCEQARELLKWGSSLAESAGESSLRCALLAAGLPPPVLQHEVSTKVGTFYTDLAWPGRARVVHGEYDGRGKYERQSARRIAEEKQRQHHIEALGDSVIRVVAENLTTVPARRHLAELFSSRLGVRRLNPRRALAG